MTHTDQRQTDADQPCPLNGPKHHADSREREQHEKPKPVTKRQKVVDGEAAGGEQDQLAEGLTLELKPIDQRNQDSQLPEDEQIPAQVRVCKLAWRGLARANSSVSLEGRPGIVQLGGRSRHCRH